MTEHNDDRTQTHVILTRDTMVSHYRIIEKIGAGGMGEVYLAEDTKLKRKVALKFLPPHLCQDDECRERFKREAQAAAKLNHPNIVHIYEVAEHNARPFFAMEHVEGQSLKDVIRDYQPGLDDIINLVLQICEGLAKAHEAGITHRDIKPSNIVIDADGRPKLVDFGLATIQGTDKLTKTGSTLGTVGYMSPEQIKVKEVDHRSDLFSLGVVLYEMIAGRLPFAADNEAATMNAVLNEVHEPLSRYKSGVSGELQRIVSKLLEKDPTLRYQSAVGLISDLKTLTRDEPSVAGKPPVDWWNRFVVVGAVIVCLIMAGYALYPRQEVSSGDKKKSLVVLPFENLGTDEDEYFAAGITDEITARLAGLSGLRVISRTSAVHYKDSGKPLKQIAKELKVDYVLEGTIRWDKSGDVDRVRIIPQLIRASDDSHVWADTFERALTQVFVVQAEIATRIADALDVTLLESEKQLLTVQPTENLVAYDYFLRAKDHWNEGNHASLDSVIHLLEKTTSLDSTFYPAYSWLVRMYGVEYINAYRRTDECKAQAKEAAEKALELAKSKPDGYIAMGTYHYYISRDYESALEQFELAARSQPNNSDLLTMTGYVYRRMGEWDIAADYLQKALMLDPLSMNIAAGLIHTLFMMHRLDEAQIVVLKGLEFEPTNRGLLFWNVALPGLGSGDSLYIMKAIERYEESTTEKMAGVLQESADIYMRRYESALARRSSTDCRNLSDSAVYYQQRGEIYRYLGDTNQSRVYFDSARVIWEAQVEASPDVADFHSPLAEVYVGLGQNLRAVEHAELATRLMPVSKDEVAGSERLVSLAVVYAWVGEYDKSIDLLDYLLSHPSRIQVGGIRLHPRWDPLRDHPRFQALIEKYSDQTEQ
ncbi:MAG: protein kinase [candidate division Zixibacteria bacterium]|nr:protein kinase [candidate division Zixibacteria bacterium]